MIISLPFQFSFEINANFLILLNLTNCHFHRRSACLWYQAVTRHGTQLWPDSSTLENKQITRNNGSPKNKQTRNKFDMGSYNCYKNGPITVSRFFDNCSWEERVIAISVTAFVYIRECKNCSFYSTNHYMIELPSLLFPLEICFIQCNTRFAKLALCNATNKVISSKVMKRNLKLGRL